MVSRSREGAWIEIMKVSLYLTLSMSRSREGAWIEIDIWHLSQKFATVAPVMERGLK